MPRQNFGNLILGDLYNDGWFNSAPIEHNSYIHCMKCNTAMTIHHLEKLISAFGNIITKLTTVYTCPKCYYESMGTVLKKQRKATKKNLSALFAKLPKSTQISILEATK